MFRLCRWTPRVCVTSIFFIRNLLNSVSWLCCCSCVLLSCCATFCSWCLVVERCLFCSWVNPSEVLCSSLLWVALPEFACPVNVLSAQGNYEDANGIKSRASGLKFSLSSKGRIILMGLTLCTEYFKTLRFAGGVLAYSNVKVQLKLDYLDTVPLCHVQKFLLVH